ncbi:putative two-component response regulator-like APRR9 [Abeliophyllum distichum]|uniref:Two-component response regulator-like APRR9 n=1 Tax=Abeliophyllum distichum TaxID=126358 RepID=A0ABD1RPM8_9LAMI
MRYHGKSHFHGNGTRNEQGMKLQEQTGLLNCKDCHQRLELKLYLGDWPIYTITCHLILPSNFDSMDEAAAMEEEKLDQKSTKEWVNRLRVLLVEPDDFIRQIIAALLRKCNYRVAAVSDGLKAWETLKGRPNNIDLILTEVEVPSISGYALLNLIMEHDMCRNIPVIMMSSEDSINIVLKCMLKGAADFLIKPVRKNELRNLWQHVWRRQIQSAGNVLQNTTTVQKNVDTTSENNAMSFRSRDNLASALRDKECRNSVSDSQGQSPILFGNASGLCNTRRDDKCGSTLDKSTSPKSYPRANMIKSGLEVATCLGACNSVATTRSDEAQACASTAVSADVEPESHTENSYINSELVEPPHEAIDLIDKFESCNEIHSHFSANDGAGKLNYFPKLELSLERSYPSCLKDEGAEEYDTLNHSKASAFSRYGSRKTLLPVSPKFSGNFPAKNDGETASHDLSVDQLPIFSTTQGFCGSSTSSHGNVNSFGQSVLPEAAIPGIQMGFTLVPRVRVDSTFTSNIHLYPSMYFPQSNILPFWSPKSQHEQPQPPNPPSSSIHSTSEVCNLEPVLQLHDSMKNPVEQTVQADDKFETVPPIVNGCSPPKSSTLCSGVASNLSSKGCGSICDKSEGNEMSTPTIAIDTLSESVNDSNVPIHDGPRETSSYRISEREAALIKFRLKRKARCYEKTVRYQNRKRLAEKRPQVKGQFVRQVQSETTPLVANSCR